VEVLNAARIHRDPGTIGGWCVADCRKIPGANGQGHTKEEARASLAEAVALILRDRREHSLHGVPAEAARDTVVLE